MRCLVSHRNKHKIHIVTAFYVKSNCMGFLIDFKLNFLSDKVKGNSLNEVDETIKLSDGCVRMPLEHSPLIMRLLSLILLLHAICV